MRRLKNLFQYSITTALYFFMSHPVFARDLESIASNLTNRTNKIAMLLVPIGFAISGIFMVVGNPRGSQLMGMTIMGAIVTLGGTSAFNWLKNIVG
ncbi:MAG: hypothetical protein ACLGHN_12870 [Bacteriovoracia bacterium]